MSGLLYKEFAINRKIYIGFIIEVLIFVFGTISLSHGGDNTESTIIQFLFIPVIYLIVGAIQGMIYGTDERKVSAYMFSSTPNGIKRIVAAKYLIISMMTLYVTLCAVMINGYYKLSDNSTGSGIRLAFICMLVQLFLRATELPFIIRFGSKYGSVIKSAILTILVLFCLWYSLFIEIPEFFSDGRFLDYAMKILDGDISRKVKITYCCAGLCVAAFYYLSYRISCLLFLRGVEEYEQ
ncbi:MAG: ABC-2 transporter permease [Clostridiales bacterium]|nr:ABC-2 transporter permease [Clostridiales bacterium]